jgi:hypothetical protein
LIHGNKTGYETDTDSGDDPADDEEGKSGRSSLHGYASGENKTGEDDAHLATHDIGNRGAEKST